VQFRKGWFKDTLSVAPIGALVVMRLDGDYYGSTMDALSGLYGRLSAGGLRSSTITARTPGPIADAP
jgi:O-methyltransferase